ncbi:MW1434 family type I TA system toxin [Streptomyces sp. NPDC004609]|uniref:Thoeris anti-defense Tad2 family protein n=1 Tax=Streptomyces sp. NPDC004609 TaxID=3364704 RepID=UPI0036C80D10
MDFSEALRAIKAGARVTRTSWVEPGKYVYWEPSREVRTPDGAVRDLVGHAVFVRPHKGSRGVAEPWLPTFDGMAGDDWAVVEETE